MFTLSSCKTEQKYICTQVWATNTYIFHCTFPEKHFHPAACHQSPVMLHFRGIKYLSRKQQDTIACILYISQQCQPEIMRNLKDTCKMSYWIYFFIMISKCQSLVTDLLFIAYQHLIDFTNGGNYFGWMEECLPDLNDLWLSREKTTMFLLIHFQIQLLHSLIT